MNDDRFFISGWTLLLGFHKKLLCDVLSMWAVWQDCFFSVELAAKSEETRGQLRHLNQEVRSIYDFIFVM